MRKKVVIGNWKMNMTGAEATSFLKMMKESVKDDSVEVAFAVPFTSINAANDVLAETCIGVAAQNVHFEPRGAYTGEISVEMLKELGVKYCIIGHSERRQYFNETDESVNKKAKVLLENGIVPVICVGESLEEREAGVHLERIEARVKKAIADIDMRFVDRIIIAYEPIWAIGTGNTATKEQAEEICSFIRYTVAKVYGLSISEKVRIQYGGSVNDANAKELFEMPNIDGALVGGASLKPSFVSIIEAAK